MAQYSDRFGEAVRQVMDAQGVSLREISKRSRGRVSAGTAQAMRDGKVVGPELIVELALACHADPNPLLKEAGWVWLRFDREAWEAARRVIFGTVEGIRQLAAV